MMPRWLSALRVSAGRRPGRLSPQRSPRRAPKEQGTGGCPLDTSCVPQGFLVPHVFNLYSNPVKVRCYHHFTGKN